MKKYVFLFVLLLVFLPSVRAANHIYLEKQYQESWCKAHNGQLEYVLPDGARVDCLTDQYVVEFDFANKWAEGIGQSLYYSRITGKQPSVGLIMERPEKEQRYLNRLNKVAEKHNITVFLMTTKDIE